MPDVRLLQLSPLLPLFNTLPNPTAYTVVGVVGSTVIPLMKGTLPGLTAVHVCAPSALLKIPPPLVAANTAFCPTATLLKNAPGGPLTEFKVSNWFVVLLTVETWVLVVDTVTVALTELCA